MVNQSGVVETMRGVGQARKVVMPCVSTEVGVQTAVYNHSNLLQWYQLVFSMYQTSTEEGSVLISPHRATFWFRTAAWDNPSRQPQSLLKETLVRWLNEYNTALLLKSFESHPLPPVTYWYTTIWEDEETLILPDKLHDAPKHGQIELPVVCSEGQMSRCSVRPGRDSSIW